VLRHQKRAPPLLVSTFFLAICRQWGSLEGECFFARPFTFSRFIFYRTHICKYIHIHILVSRVLRHKTRAPHILASPLFNANYSGAASQASAFSLGHSRFPYLCIYICTYIHHININMYIYIYVYLVCCAAKHLRPICLPLPSSSPPTAGQPRKSTFSCDHSYFL